MHYREHFAVFIVQDNNGLLLRAARITAHNDYSILTHLQELSLSKPLHGRISRMFHLKSSQPHHLQDT